MKFVPFDIVKFAPTGGVVNDWSPYIKSPGTKDVKGFEVKNCTLEGFAIMLTESQTF
jgi:hypothetical protein